MLFHTISFQHRDPALSAVLCDLTLKSEDVVELQRLVAKEMATPSDKRIPGVIQIGTLFNDRLILLKPLKAKVTKENEFFVAECDVLEEFGYGYSWMEAVDDLRMTVEELYFGLKAEKERLGSDLQKIWVELQNIIREI